MTPHDSERQGRSSRPGRPLLARRRRTRLAALFALPVAAATVVAPATQASADAEEPAAAAASASSWLPFELPAKSTLRASSKKVFANWVPSLPISLDNKAPDVDYYQRNYLSPTGEKSKHASYGGYLRDRPLGRAPLATSAWRLEDMKTEVRQAISEGIDGFTVVLYNLPANGNQQWTNVNLMYQAAAAVDPGFKIIAMPDMSSYAKLREIDTGTMARRMAELGKYRSAYRVDGKLVLSPFTAEGRDPAWWTTVLNTMKTTYKTPVNFFPLFQNEQVQGPRFSAISWGMANWGTRNPKWTDPNNTTKTGPVARVNTVQARGDKWMAPISVQDERPRESKYWEPQNTTNLRNSWEIARKAGADWAQVVTWNDLPEGSGMQPSMKHGFSFLDINAYYLTWFKTGRQPAVVRDAVYLTHRKQPLAAKPTFKQSKLMKHAGGSPGRDTVEALVFARGAGTVQVTTGGRTTSCAVKAGVNVCTVPLGIGTVSAKVVRGGATVASLTSPTKVTNTPYVQDFEYVGSSSLRQGTTTSTPAPVPTPPTPTPAPTSSTRTVTPVADAYGNLGAATTRFGSTSSLAARGTPGATAYLRFTVPPAPSGKTLVRASLRVRTTAEKVAGSTTTQTIRLADDDWTESALTWVNRPAVRGATLGTLKGPRASTVYTSSLSAAALRPQLGKQVTIAVTGAGDDAIWFWSRNHANPGYRPQLVLDFG